MGADSPIGMDTSRSHAHELDAADPLAAFPDRFDPPGCYMDGNSLGPISQDAVQTMERVREEWRTLAIEGWTDGDPPWFGYAEALGDCLASLVGADGESVVSPTRRRSTSTRWSIRSSTTAASSSTNSISPPTTTRFGRN